MRRACFLLERGTPPRLNPIMAEVFELLELRQVEVSVRFPEQELWRIDQLRVEADVYLLKSDTELALSLALSLERMGGRVLNRASASLLAKDKLLTAARLAQMGLPAPAALAAAHPARLASRVSADGPLILKPHRGYHGVGVGVVSQPDELPGAAAYPEVVFAQEYLAHAERDLKVFVIGEEVFGVRKAFAEDSFLQAGRPTPVPPEVESLARRCGEAFGLELFGLDVAEDPERGPLIIDLNYFPGYRGVPNAARRLASYILRSLDARA